MAVSNSRQAVGRPPRIRSTESGIPAPLLATALRLLFRSALRDINRDDA
jgi:hypothetical protein